jgi:hypothetical protein
MTDKPDPLNTTNNTKEINHIEGEALPSFEGTGLADNTVKALEEMAFEGKSLSLAAKANNIRTDNLTRTFNKPHIRHVYNQLVKTIKENAGMQAYIRNIQLSQTSGSDHVRADLNKWIAGVDGIAALKRVEGKFSHTHAFGGFDYPDPEPIDVTPTEPETDIQSVDADD